jgi:nucleoside-diphosphate-sugar epimerase
VHAVVTGGLGFLGRALTDRLRKRGDDVAVYDAAQGDDVCDTERLRGVVRRGGVVFHLAAVRGAQGERDFDLALRVNLDGTRSVLEACRARGEIRLVFASTLAVYGGSAMPAEVDEQIRPNPQTTYGTTKGIAELLIADYRRKGFVDGRIGRLPTIIVRPDAPALASSGFASAVFRESLAGRDCVLPVGPGMHVFVIGVGTAADCLIALADLPPVSLGDDPVVNLPGVAATAKGLIEAARRAGATGSIDVRPDSEIEAIVGSWPRTARSERALALGLPKDDGIDAIVREYAAGATLTA